MKRLWILGSIISVTILAVTVLAVANAFGVMRTASAENTAEQKIHACLTCCSQKQSDCDEANNGTQKCYMEYNSCVATCNSDGTTPSDWGASCWGH